MVCSTCVTSRRVSWSEWGYGVGRQPQLHGEAGAAVGAAHGHRHGRDPAPVGFAQPGDLAGGHGGLQQQSCAFHPERELVFPDSGRGEEACNVHAHLSIEPEQGAVVGGIFPGVEHDTAYLLNWTYAGQVDFTDGLPLGGVDYPRTYQEFRAWFPDDASCAEYLARLRSPEGFRCPVCGGDKAWQTSTQHWKCAGCGHKPR